MSDGVIIAIAGAVPLTVAAIGGIVGAIFSYKALQLNIKNHAENLAKGTELKQMVNGRMDQMLDVTRELGKAEGAAAAQSGTAPAQTLTTK